MKPLNSSQESIQINEQEDKLLDKYFSEVKKEKYDTSSIPLFDWIENAGGITGGRYSAKRESISSIMFSKYKQKFALVVFLLIALSIAMTVPVKQTQTVASVLSWKINKADKDVIKKLDNLEGIDKNLLTADLNNVGDSSSIIYKLVLPNPDNEKISKLQSDLENLHGVASVQLTPINESYSKPVFALVMGKLFDVQVNTPRIDENEARSNISRQLVYAGVPSNLNFEFASNPSGFNIVNASFPVARDTIKKYYKENNILIAPDADDIIKQVDKIIRVQTLRVDSIQAEVNRQIQKSFTPQMMESMEDIVGKVDLAEILDNVKESLQELKETLRSDTFKNRIYKQNKTYLDSLKKFNEDEYRDKMEEYKERMQDLKEGLQNYQESIQDLKEGIQDYKENIQDYKEEMKNYENEMKEGMKEYEEGMKEYKQGMDELRQQMKEMKIDRNPGDRRDYEEEMKEYKKGMDEFKKGMDEYKKQMKDLKFNLKGLSDSLKININIDTNIFRYIPGTELPDTKFFKEESDPGSDEGTETPDPATTPDHSTD